MSFEQRSLTAFAYEKTVPDELRWRGWDVQEIGMGTWSPATKRVLIPLRDTYGRPCLFRWLPDFIVTRDRFGKPQAYLVDAKNLQKRERPTGNFSIERNALEAYQAIERTFFIPVVMLAEGGHVLTVHDAINRGTELRDGFGTNGGSGTAYCLVRKVYAVSVNDFFGAPIK